METVEKSVSLFYKEGKSDKEYRIFLKKKGKGYIVDICYGRRGNSLTSSQKTPIPLDLDAATAIFEKLYHDKKLKGYCEEEGQVPYVGSDKENKITGVLPQLLNNIDEEDLDDYFNDPNYCLQEKKDGKRILFRKQGGILEAINRKGLLVGFPTNIQTELEKIQVDFIFDGELIGEKIWFFDALQLDNTSLSKQPYKVRYKILERSISGISSDVSSIQLVETSFGKKEKKQSYNLLKKQGVEGVVFKKLDAPYKAGRPSSGGDQLKFKFTNMATCQVSAHNEKGKRSVYIQMLDGEELIDVGKVTILPNFEIPKIGEMVEVRYLYKHVHGSLYQPIYLGVRDDKDTPDQLNSLKVKEGIEDEEES